ncbi:DUF2628 domain-containing protein [Cohnella herbarum]|uniref:DUF2628 domain-containing protein n=1 Tax=Cohnella herbarum TaxID=2728023 RepID=A0A7Z2ZNR6_9BACL|nr:DUF2628 domain-containing protein [Cohnella herbarum]QJD86359.1 DUF2628 domain-containing protein [Cohnella herbarum]
MNQVDEEIEVQSDEESGISDELLLAFSKKEVYLKKWKKPSSWNWAFFLFGPLWLAYRKMYVETAIYFGIMLLIYLMELLTDALGSILILNLLVWVLMGAFGDKIYYRKAKKTIEEIILQKEKETRLFLISKKGGTSGWGLVICGIGSTVAIVFVMSLLESLIGSSTNGLFYPKSSKVIFAKDIDSDINPIEPGETFSQGNVRVILYANAEFAVDSIKISIVKVDVGVEYEIAVQDVPVEPKWGKFSFEYSFTEDGQYRVSITKPSGDLIAEGIVNIGEKNTNREVVTARMSLMPT